MSSLLTSSKPRKIQFFVSAGGFTSILFLLGLFSSVPLLLLVTMLAILDICIFGLMKFLDYDDKLERYEKDGYTYLATTESGERVFSFIPKTSKLMPDSTILLAFFDEEGCLTRQSRVFKQDVEYAQLLLGENEKKDKER